MTPEQCIYRAEQAKRLLEDPILSEALETIKTAIREQVFALAIEAKEDREKLILMDKLRQQLVNTLEMVIRGGEVSRHELLMERNTTTRLDAIREQARNYAG